MLIRLVRGVEGQWFQKEVFRGAAPVALLQLGQCPLVKLDGVGVRVGPGPHGPRHTEIPLGRERPPAALVLVAQQTTSSPWARFFLKLGTRQIKRSSNYLCSAWHLAELTLPQEQGTWCQLTLPQGTLALLYWLLHRGRLLELWCYYSRDFEWLNVYMFRFAYLHVYVYIYIHTEYICIYKIMHLSVIWFLKKQINTDCYLKAILIAVQVEADGRGSELPCHQNKHIFLLVSNTKIVLLCISLVSRGVKLCLTKNKSFVL